MKNFDEALEILLPIFGERVGECAGMFISCTSYGVYRAKNSGCVTSAFDK